MTKQQQKTLLICVVIVVASYIVRSIVTGAMQMAYYQQQAARAAQQKKAKEKEKPKPAPTAKAPAPPSPNVAARGKTQPPASKKAPPSPFAKLNGVWHGRAALDGRGICNLRFELKEKQDEPGHFSGFSSMTCVAAKPLMRQKGIDRRAFALNRMDPEGAILSGKAENGSIQLHTDKTVGTDSNGCAPTSFTVTPFGSNQLAAEWREGTSCSGGNMILGKARR